jgi:hypothetical protein
MLFCQLYPSTATFSGQKESTNHFRPQYVMQVSKCIYGAVLNLEITAIVQILMSFFSSKQKRNRGISKKGFKTASSTVIFTSDVVKKTKKQEPSWQHRP